VVRTRSSAATSGLRFLVTSPQKRLPGPAFQARLASPNETWYHFHARKMPAMECLVTMTTRVPEASLGKAVEDIRGRGRGTRRKRWQRITPIR
jgi:hypothetical protein